MAKRTMRPYQDERARAAIQTSQLLNRLRDHVFGKIELSPTQVKSCEILLRKTLPDLSTIEHVGEVEHFVVHVPALAVDAGAWQREHTPLPAPGDVIQ